MKNDIKKLIEFLEERFSVLNPAQYIITEHFNETKQYNIKNLVGYIEYGALYLRDDDYFLLKNGCTSSCFLIKDIIKLIEISEHNIKISFKSGQVEIEAI